MTWSKIKSSGDTPLYGRMGHSANIYKKQIVVFGGEKKFNLTTKSRECLADVKLFNSGINEGNCGILIIFVRE